MQAFLIIALAIGGAVVYGVVHDQITARICVEYFTIGHPPVFHTESPTLLGLGWGIIATWWVGAILGTGLAIAARAGSRPKRDWRSLVRPIAILLGAMAVTAAIAGVVGYAGAESGHVRLIGPIAEILPIERHSVFLADLWSHIAGYAGGFIGGAVVCVMTWRSRGAMAERMPRALVGVLLLAVLVGCNGKPAPTGPEPGAARLAFGALSGRLADSWRAAQTEDWPAAEARAAEAEAGFAAARDLLPPAVRTEQAALIREAEQQLPALRKAAAGRDRAGFETAWRRTAAACNACHSATRTEFTVEPPRR